jgi:uncharacterized protein YidB (DUF937 family)
LTFNVEYARLAAMRHQPIDVERVKDLAASLGIDSVAELSRRSGVSQWVLYKILSGERPALPSQTNALAETLGVEPADLLAADEATIS